MRSIQFIENRLFIKPVGVSRLKYWTAWSHSYNELFKPLFSRSERAYLFGNIFFNGNEYVIGGEGYFRQPKSSEVMSLGIKESDECYHDVMGVVFEVAEYIRNNFTEIDGFLACTASVDVFDSNIGKNLLAGITGVLSTNIMFIMDSSELEVINNVIALNSMLTAEKSWCRYGNWKVRDKAAKRYVEEGKVALIVAQGCIFSLYPDECEVFFNLLSDRVYAHAKELKSKFIGLAG